MATLVVHIHVHVNKCTHSRFREFISIGEMFFFLSFISCSVLPRIHITHNYTYINVEKQAKAHATNNIYIHVYMYNVQCMHMNTLPSTHTLTHTHTLSHTHTLTLSHTHSHTHTPDYRPWRSQGSPVHSLREA